MVLLVQVLLLSQSASGASDVSSISKPVVLPTDSVSSHSTGLTSTGIVSEYPTTGTDGVVGTGTTTIPITASGSSSHSSIFTTTWTDSAGLTSTGIVSEYPTTGTDGVVGTGTTTIPITASGSSSHSSIFTTTWTDSAGLTSTGIVSEYPTTGTDGVVGTGTTTIPITASRTFI
ncbi:unnamed protein product [Wickerhamomyces anomalus]